MASPYPEGFRALSTRYQQSLGDPFRISYPKESGGSTIKDGTPVLKSSAGAESILRVSVTAGVAEVNTITITGTPTGGSFTISYTGMGSTQTTAAIAYNATAATVQNALQALSNLGAGNVTVTGGPGPGTPYVLTFTGYLASKVITTVTTTDSFTGGSSPASAVVKTTSGTQGRISSTTFFAFADEWETDIGAAGAYGREFPMPPANLDGKFVTDANAILVEPVGVGKVFTARISHDVAVAASMSGNTYDIGYNLSRDDFYINTGTTTNALARIVSVQPDQVGIFGGLVDFVIPAAAIQAVI